MSTTFSARLNRLFDTVYPPGRGPHTSAEVIAALKAEGITMSAPYLSQLRSGNQTPVGNHGRSGELLPASGPRTSPMTSSTRSSTKSCRGAGHAQRGYGVSRFHQRVVPRGTEDIVHRVDELRRKEPWTPDGSCHGRPG